MEHVVSFSRFVHIGRDLKCGGSLRDAEINFSSRLVSSHFKESHKHTMSNSHRESIELLLAKVDPENPRNMLMLDV